MMTIEEIMNDMLEVVDDCLIHEEPVPLRVVK